MLHQALCWQRGKAEGLIGSGGAVPASLSRSPELVPYAVAASLHAILRKALPPTRAAPKPATARLNFQPRRLLLAVRLLVVSSVRVSHLDTVDLWGWVIPCLGWGGGVLCVVGCFAASLASTHPHKKRVMPTPRPPKMSSKVASCLPKLPDVPWERERE